MTIKIDKNTSPYDAVVEEVVKRAGSYCDTYIVRLKTALLGESTVVMSPNGYGWYDFDTDWYEGGDEVELLGFIKLEDIDVLPLQE